ncbi:MAG: DUF1801 domain-containing protein [Ferruginibacter sp.]
MKSKLAASVEEYIAAFPEEVQKALNQMRKTIKANAPGAEEGIFYAMPGYKYSGKPLVYFAGYANHIGFYATPTGHDAFKDDLAKYKQGKGSVQFPLNEKLPLKLIERIVKFRLKGNELKTAGAGKKKATPPIKKAGKIKLTDAEQVKAWLEALEPVQRKATDTVRKIIRSAAPALHERIKWNAPSFYYKEDDVVTFGPYRNNKLLLVFHHPLVTKIKSSLLEGNYKDRRLLYLQPDIKSINAAKAEITRIIKEHMTLLDQ